MEIRMILSNYGVFGALWKPNAFTMVKAGYAKFFPIYLESKWKNQTTFNAGWTSRFLGNTDFLLLRCIF